MCFNKFKKLLDCLQWLAQQHIWRYVFASGFSRHKIILDLACGVGYGADYLSNSGKTVVGIDNSLESIAFARKNYPSPNLLFIQADCGLLPFRNQTFDLVTSFETIEHITDRDGYLHEIRRSLKPEGTFLCSTPNKNHSLSHIDHLHEFIPGEFRDLLRRYFKGVTLCQQLCRRDDWLALDRKNRRAGKRLRTFLARTRRKIKRSIYGVPFGSRLIDCVKFNLGRATPPPLSKEKASITPRILDSLDPCLRIQQDLQGRSPGWLDNSLVAVCTDPWTSSEFVREAIGRQLGQVAPHSLVKIAEPSVISSPGYKEIIDRIVEVSQKTKWACYRGDLLASRRWEYPWALESLDLKPGMKVLDAGCSLDPFTPYLTLQGYRVVGIDNFSSHDIQWDPDRGIFSGALTGFAKLVKFKEYCRQVLGQEIRYENQDMAATNFSDQYFDRIVSISVLEHLPVYKRKIVLFEWERILTDGGRVVLTIDYINQGEIFNISGLIRNSPFELTGEVSLFFPDDGAPAVAGLVLKKRKPWTKRPGFFARGYQKHELLRTGLDRLVRTGTYYWRRVKTFIGR